MKFPASKGVTYGLPSLIYDLVLWFDGMNADGSNNATLTNGQAMSQWNDLSGNNYHATQGTALYQPSFQSFENGINKLASIYFAGDASGNAGDYLKTATSITCGASYSMFAVVLPDVGSLGVNRDIFRIVDNFVTQNNAGSITCVGANRDFRFLHSVSATSNDLRSAPIDTWDDRVNIISAIRDYSASAYVKINNVNFITGGSVSVGAFAINPMLAAIGCFNETIQRFYKGAMGEILFYNRALTANEVAAVQGYLHKKWNAEL